MSVFHRSMNRRTFAAGVTGSAALGAIASPGGLAAAQSATPASPAAAPSNLPEALPSGGTQPDGTWAFSDDRGEVATLAATPTKVVAYAGFAAALFDLGFEVVGYVGAGQLEDGSPAPVAGRLPVDRLPRVDESGELDSEMLLVLGAELYVGPNYDITADPPILWPLSPDASTQIREVVPTISIAASDGTDARRTILSLANLAGALGVDLDTPDNTRFAAGFEAAVQDLEAAIAEQPGLTTLWMAGSSTGWWPAFDYNDLTLYRNLGLRFVNDGFEVQSEQSWETFVSEWPCDLIFNDDRQPNWWAVDQLRAEVPTYPLHPAVVAGQVVPWRVTFVPSFQGFTPDLIAVTAAIRAARVDVV